jgi:N-acetylglutamate synthase-like GNAT family acetyltransferase
MPMNSPDGSFAVRPPWPDELSRMRSLLPVEGFREPPWLWVLALDQPERLVGAAALEPFTPPAQGARLYLSLRPRFRSDPAGAALVQATADKARSLKCLPVSFQCLHEPAPQQPLEKAGFALVRSEQLWELPVEAVHQRVRRASASISRRLQRLGEVWQGPPGPEHLAAISRILHDHQLGPAGSLQFSDERQPAGTGSAPGSEPALEPGRSNPADSAAVFNRNLSNIVTVNGRVAALALTKDLGPARCVVQYRAVAPEFLSHSATLNVVLMERPLKLGLSLGIRSILATAQVGRQDETIHLAAKSLGRLLQTTDIYHLTR